MREIKFRAWNSTTKKQEWGPFYLNEDGDVFEMVDGYEPYLKQRVGWTIEQFTGLHDKNGKEIYEGDIIQFTYGLGRVFWSEATASFKVSFDIDNDELWYYCGKNTEVIGNIHENPELVSV